MNLSSGANARRKSTVSLIVKTRDGKTYDLGLQKNTGIFRHYYRWRQNRNITNYFTSRLKTLTDPKEIQEFTEQIDNIKTQLKGQTNG